MISIVCCSIDPDRASWIANHYHALCGHEPHEILVIDNPRSLAEGYNHGIDTSRGSIVVFSHDDLEFLEPANWLARLKGHLENFDLLGLAGTSKLISAAWANAGPPYTFGQVGELDGRRAPFRVLLCAVPAPAIPGIQALDGLFLAARRSLLERVRFDATTFDGFHAYDIDFSFRAHLAGFRVAVAADLPVLHASQGKFDWQWEHFASRFMHKHAAHLPAFRLRPFQHAFVGAQTKDELLEILQGARTQWHARGPTSPAA